MQSLSFKDVQTLASELVLKELQLTWSKASDLAPLSERQRVCLSLLGYILSTFTHLLAYTYLALLNTSQAVKSHINRYSLLRYMADIISSEQPKKSSSTHATSALASRMESYFQLPPVIPSPSFREYHATVEHVDDHWDDDYSSASTTPLTLSSRASEQDEEEIEEVLPAATLCRRNTAEMATSLWGIVPPTNFSRVLPAVYRGGFPQRENLSFLKRLGLKSVLTLVNEEYSDHHNRFLAENGIHHFRVHIQANKNPNAMQSQVNMVAALNIILDRSNHPMLIHCNQGKHRTGCVVGCLRKVMGWKQKDYFAEYQHFAGTKARPLDQVFIDQFDERALLWQARINDFTPMDVPLIESPIPLVPANTRLRT